MPQTITHSPSLWVYLGTDIPATVDESSLFEQRSNPVTGQIEQGLLLDIEVGKTFLVEKITQTIQKERQAFYAKNFWVETNKNNRHEGVDIRALTDKKMKNGLIVGGNLLLQDGSSISLEIISHQTLYSRNYKKEMVWVVSGGVELYTHQINPEKLTQTKSVNGLVKATLALADGSTISLDYLSKKQHRLRMSGKKEVSSKGRVWVQAGTNKSVPYPDNAEILEETTKKSVIQRKLLLEDGSTISLEHISKSTQDSRTEREQRVWIDVGTGEPYTDDFDTKDLTHTQEKNGLIVSGILELSDGRTYSLAFISKRDWGVYKRYWVETGSDTIFTYPENAVIIEEVTKKDILYRTLLLENGDTVSLEFITKGTLAARKIDRNKIWIYGDTSKPYPYPVDADKFTVEKTFRGVVYGTLALEGNNTISLQYIAKGAQKGRMKAKKQARTRTNTTSSASTTTTTSTSAFVSTRTIDLQSVAQSESYRSAKRPRNESSSSTLFGHAYQAPHPYGHTDLYAPSTQIVPSSNGYPLRSFASLPNNQATVIPEKEWNLEQSTFGMRSK